MSITYPNGCNTITINNNITSSSGGSPGGSNGDIQYNANGVLQATASLTFNTGSGTLTVPNLTSTGIRVVSNSQDAFPGVSQYFTGSSGSLGPFNATIWTIAGSGSSPITFDPVEPITVTGSVVGQELWLLSIDGNTTFTIPNSATTTAFSGSQNIELTFYSFVKFVLMPGDPNYWIQTSPVMKLV